jgi:hypothetical protein
MSYFAKVVNNKVVVVIKAEQDFIDIYDDGTGEGEWIQTSYNTFGGKHYGRDGIEDDKPQLRYNYAGVGFTYDKEKDAFISPPMHPSFVLNETTMRYGIGGSYLIVVSFNTKLGCIGGEIKASFSLSYVKPTPA